MNTLITSLIVFICTSVLGACGGFIAATYSRFSRRIDALFKLTKAQGRKEIVDAYQTYVVEGRHMTVERQHELTETYEAYTELGGNGTAKRLWVELENVDPWIVTD